MFEQILVVVSITFFVMVSPGPDMVMVMRNTLVDGRPAGIWSSIGVLAGNAVHMTYCVLGIGWLISQSIVAFSVLKYAGAAYLIYLGVVSLRAGASSLDSVTATRAGSDRRWFLQGFGGMEAAHRRSVGSGSDCGRLDRQRGHATRRRRADGSRKSATRRGFTVGRVGRNLSRLARGAQRN